MIEAPKTNEAQMTGLPHADSAEIDRRKIINYLLSIHHPAGRAKAAFVNQFGFRVSSWRNFRAALIEHARNAETISIINTPFGRNYILEGVLPAPDGRDPRIRTIWFVASDAIYGHDWSLHTGQQEAVR